MKKIYMKPRMHAEMFVLSQNIAETCGYKDENYLGSPAHGDKYACGWNDGMGNTYWLDGVATCSTVVGEDFVHEEYCYNNPTGLLTIFAS